MSTESSTSPDGSDQAAGPPRPTTLPQQTAPPTPTPDPLAAWRVATADVARLAAADGGRVSVTWTELGGPSPQTFSLGGDDSFFAASTYKLPLLIAEAQAVDAGRAAGPDVICFQPDDYEPGWFDDYAGNCFSRDELSNRIGLFSDNTAAHMLTRELGGSDALNQAARAMGATESEFFFGNTTTANDLAAILAAVGSGRAATPRAFSWLQPKLTKTQFESGIPDGVAQPGVVLHKVGEYGTITNDAALVTGGPGGAYVLVVCTDGAGGGGGDNAWPLIRDLSSRVWAYEATR